MGSRCVRGCDLLRGDTEASRGKALHEISQQIEMATSECQQIPISVLNIVLPRYTDQTDFCGCR